MRLLAALFILLLLITSGAQAVTFKFDKELAPCFSLPEYAEDGKSQSECKAQARERSDEALSKTIERLYKTIDNNYDVPFKLNDFGGVTMSAVFRERFARSQALWLQSREAFCAARASLVGEWAPTQYDLESQCVIDMNHARQHEIESLYGLTP
ncbi:lysozyme inhibitor LprI family protein [Cronobacter sakazakii]